MKKNRVLLFLIIFLLSLFILYYYLFNNYNFGIDCIFHKITGLHCPGCGITRMLFSLITLDIYQAFRYNPLLFILLPFFMVLIIDVVIKIFKHKSNYLYKRIDNRFWIFLSIVLLVFGIFRNVPGFEFLKPTDIL